MSQRLSFPRVWEGSRRTSQGQNRTREIRPSGIVGGPMETWDMGVGLRPGGKSPEPPPNPNTVARRSSIPAHRTLVVKYQELTPFPSERYGDGPSSVNPKVDYS